MKKFMKSLALTVALTFILSVLGITVSADDNGIGQIKKQSEYLSLQQINDLVKNELDGQKALSNVAYEYQGWRTNGGPWFNANLKWLEQQLKGLKFSEGKDSSGDNYWEQKDIRTGQIWAPQYASLEIVGPEGDAVVGQDYHFDFKLDTFDPTSKYYPKNIDQNWIMSHIGTKEEAAIDERVHLATSSGFTSPMNTELSDAEAYAKTAEVVYVGNVSYDRSTKVYSWDQNKDADLKGKIIFATSTRSNAYNLAKQVGAVASLCSQINAYNNPVINGKELYPNTVQFAGVTNSDPKAPMAFNLSPMDQKYLISLLDKAKANNTKVMMKAMAIGGFYPYSQENPLNTLVAEIKGTSKAKERVVFLGHLQEAGACDNSTGVGLQLEVVRTLKKMIDDGRLPRPERTLTFIWGAETIMGTLWGNQNPEAFKNVKAALVLDMVGEDPVKTGGIMRIEKSPDPSAVYNYGLDLLPGQTPEPGEEYVRQPDTHTLWGAGELPFNPFPGHFLNDLYFKSASLVAQDSPGFQVGSNPYEGGSDHDSFLQNKETNPDGTVVYKPLPALLTWHFTDYVYHTSMDTMDKVSSRELKDVGVTTINVGYMIANADEKEAADTMEIVRDRAAWRFGWEMKNSQGSLKWAYDKAAANKQDTATAIDKALANEKEILNAWGTWYKEAVQSARQLCGTNPTEGYIKLEKKYLDDVNNLLIKAVENAEKIAKDLNKKN